MTNDTPMSMEAEIQRLRVQLAEATDRDGLVSKLVEKNEEIQRATDAWRRVDLARQEAQAGRMRAESQRDTLLEAVKVVALTPHIRAWLAEHDPMALAQLRAAIANVED